MPRFWLALLVSVSLALPLSAVSAQAQEWPGTFSAPYPVTQPGVRSIEQAPVAVEFKGKLHLFWTSRGLEAKGGWDADLMHSSFDGETWSAPDMLTHGDDGDDHTPSAAVLGDKLYVFWSSDDSLLGGGGTDIACMAFDGRAWTSPTSISSGLHSGGDFNPSAVAAGGRLYVFYERFSVNSGYYEMAYAVLDGLLWGGPYKITDGSDGSNVNPSAVAWGEEVVLCWESYDTRWTSNATDTAIVSTFVVGGSNSSAVSLSGNGVGRNSRPALAAYGNDVWAFWSSTAPALSGGSDWDIVARRYSGTWEDDVYELTPGDSGNDTTASAIEYKGGLYLAWLSDSPGITTGSDTDLVLRRYDGQEWGSVMELTPGDGDVNDGGGLSEEAPSVVVFKDHLHIIWETNADPRFGIQSDSTWLIAVGYSEPEVVEERSNLLPTVVLVVMAAALVATALLVYRKYR